MMRKLLLFFLLCPAAFAQNGAAPAATAFQTVNGTTRPIPNATITVCAANASGIPCSPALVSGIFNATGGALTNPFFADANGNYQFFAATGSTYTVSVTASGFSGYSYQVTIGLSVLGILSSTNTWTAPQTFSAGISGLNVVGLGTTNPFTGTESHSGTESFTGPFSTSGVDTITGPINMTGVGSAAVQTALNTLTSGEMLFIPCGTYTGPTTIPSAVSLISLCATAATPINLAGTGLSAQTVFTYSSQLTLTSETNVRLQGITMAFADSGFGVTLSNDFNFNWSYVNLHECGNTTTPCLLITTNGTTSSNNSADNYFDHMIIKANTAGGQNAIAIQLLGQGTVGSGSIATDNEFDDIILGGNLRMGVDCELNSDSNVFRGMQVFQVLGSPVANTAILVLNNNTPASDQDADNEHFYDVFYTGAAWHGVRAGQIYGGDFGLASSASDVVVAGGTPSYLLKVTGLLATPSSIQAPNMSATRFFGNGTPMNTSKFAFGGNWGTSPSFTTAHGTDMAWMLQLSSGSGSPGANPTITLTFNDGAFTNPPVCTIARADSQAPASAYWAVPYPGSGSSLTVTFVGTPAASTSYALDVVCLGSPN